MNEPIDTDKDGNALTLMDVMATEDNICDNLDSKIKSEQLRRFVKESSPRGSEPSLRSDTVWRVVVPSHNGRSPS